MLTPILVSGYGRSGTTALMSLLATDSRLVMDRVYPFEHRYLTYFAKCSALLERQDSTVEIKDRELCDFEDSHFGAQPWASSTRSAGAAGTLAAPCIRALWEGFSEQAVRDVPGAVFYAEKAPAWLAPLMREVLPPFTAYLFRDPRDMYLSANAFMQKRNYYGFGRSPADSDLDHARNLTHSFLEYFENYFVDRRRADCLLVRYEDLVLKTDELKSRLKQQLSLNVTPWTPSSWLETHRTTPDAARSVYRWRKEAIPVEVHRFLETYLGFEMAHLCYPASLPLRPQPLPSIDFHTGGLDMQAVSCSLDGELHLNEHNGDVTIRGADFWMSLPLPEFPAEAVREIWISVKGTAGKVCSVYWRHDGEDYTEDRSVHVSFKGGFHWQVLRFRMASHPLWKGSITGLRFDPFNGTRPAATETGAIRWLRLIE